MSPKKIALLALFSLFLTGLSIAAEKPLASKELTQALVEEVSGEIAFRYTERISRFDRIQASEGWHDAAVFIKNELEKIGFREIVLESWPSNGSNRYFTRRSPIGWKAEKAELWLVSPHKERLCSLEEMPLTLVKHSHSADVEAELVDVGSGIGEESYRNKDVKGKIVLATGSTGAVTREAVVKKGAVGVITYFSPETRPGYPQMIRYTAIWPTWEERETIGFGFNVSKLQGWNLKKMLEEGKKVILKAEIKAEFSQTRIEALSAAFPGTEEPQREVMIIGHLCHPTPSANDNASGSGGMLEMARALKSMVDKGLIAAPKRTIRFLWVPEFGGTYPYVQEHLERTRRTLAVFNCDMIGEDLHKTGGIFTITATPDSVPSFLNDVVPNFARHVESLGLKSPNGSLNPFVFQVEPFSGGSDHHVFGDGALRVPAVMLGHGDIFHHTSLDTMDKVDSSELRRICAITLGTACYLASASAAEAGELALLIARNGSGRLSADFYDHLVALFQAEKEKALQAAFRQLLNVLAHSTARENQAVLSTLVFAKDDKIKSEIKATAEALRMISSLLEAEAKKHYDGACRRLKMKPSAMTLTAEEKKLARVVPVRATDFICPLEQDYLVEKLGEEALKGLRLGGYSAYEALNFTDGKRSIYEIERAVSAEYGPVEMAEILEFFKILEKAGLVTLKYI